MKTLTAFDAKTHFGALLDRVQSGEEVVITRRGQVVARVIPEGLDDVDNRQDLVTAMRASREAIRKSNGSLDMRELIDEGRRY
ncbi:MAG: type II toxin-antitoxin system prevent-host-death family antitoxin [Verrucomicrobiales bacterium]|nr:type II toxin-antitoxin system prevent-host-death family antitoxin [Verrucomicrobiales bacterium]